MSFNDVIEQASDAIGVRRVFGEPYEKNGVTVIPAARIVGGVGGGEGKGPAPEEGEESSSTGSGGGFGLVGRPAGAIVIRGNGVAWVPAVDVNRLLFGFQVVLVVLLLVVRSIVRARAETARVRASAGAA